MLATVGPEGLDCSPRGDLPGFVTVRDAKTLLIPDRKGNNRLDSLRNILSDDRIGMLFLIPGYGETLRVNGTAVLSTDPELCARFEMAGKLPACVIVVTVEAAYFQCSLAVVRADLWNPEKFRDPSLLPTVGQMLASVRKDFDGRAYDREWPGRAAKTMW